MSGSEEEEERIGSMTSDKIREITQRFEEDDEDA